MKKCAVMVLAVMLIGVMASVASSGVVYGEPGWEDEGEGMSEERAWEINSPEVLAKMRDDVNSGKFTSARYYKLTSDINLANLANWLWEPIGGRTYSWLFEPTNKFIGHFDGNGHTIKVHITRIGGGGDDVQETGLFGMVDSGGSIKNLSVSGDVDATSLTNNDTIRVGGIASCLREGTIENCNFDGTVKGSFAGGAKGWCFVGGIVGYASEKTTITGCKVGSISATSISSTGGKLFGYEGGIVGFLYDESSSCRVTDNYADVTLSGNCYHSGAIYGDRFGKGIVENNTTGNPGQDDPGDDNGGTGGGNGSGGNNGDSGGNNDNSGGNNDGGNSGGNSGGNGGNSGGNGGNGGNTTITINGSFPNGTVNTAYQASVTVSGGTSPYEWSYSGTPPTGTTFSLSDSTETAYLTGTPTAAGTYTFSLTVADSSSREISRSFNVTISGSNSSGGGGGGGCNSGFAILTLALSAVITLRKSRN